MTEVVASLAGTIFKVLVKPGDHVAVGQEVVIMESMKMEIPIEAEAAGTVRSVSAKEGDFVNDGEVLVVLE